MGELAPLRRHRFVPAETALALFQAAPAIDYQRLRLELDTIASQDASWLNNPVLSRIARHR